ILADEPVRRGTGGEADAELLAEIGERKPLEVDLDVRVLLHEELDALVHPWALLRIVESPEAEIDRLLGLREGAGRDRCRGGGSQSRGADAANHVSSRRLVALRCRHGLLPD